MISNPDELLRRYVRGELRRDELPAELRSEADALARTVRAARDEGVQAPGWLYTAVMARVRQPEVPRWRRAAEWVIAPRTVRVSPLAGGLALAAAVALVLLARPAGAPAGGDAGSGVSLVAGVSTRFVLVAPQASSVAVTGDFVDWDPQGVAMQDSTGSGVWVGELQIDPGVHQYVFIVDGAEWRPDPNATSQVDDGFGQVNSVLLVPERSSS